MPDLGFAEPEARVHTMRSELMIAIEKMIDEQHLSQTEAARILKVSQSGVSDLRRGKIEKLSLDMLVTVAGRLGTAYELKCAD